MFRDKLTHVDERAGGIGDWMSRLRDNVVEAKDRSIEVTLARPGGAMWREMKENARMASEHPAGRGAMQILAARARAAIATLSESARSSLELHLVGHSAGSIFAAHSLGMLTGSGIPLRSFQLMAPAITTDRFRKLVLPHVKSGRCPLPTIYVLSDAGERDDNLGPYGKSLLFLVSNAFEEARSEALLGMERFVSDRGESGGRFTQPDLLALFRQRPNGLPSLVVAGDPNAKAPSVSRSQTHGGFDNDPDTMNSVLERILGAPPTRPFGLRDLRF
jgi:hypothetical protein